MVTVTQPVTWRDTCRTYQVTPQEWARTPPSVRRMTEAFWAELQRLREAAGQTSRNSSRPPASDPPSVPKRRTAPTGRKVGGQPGHASTAKPLAPPDQVDQVIPVRPDRCAHCGTAFPADAADPAPRRHQVTEIPLITRVITEYQLHTLVCPGCGQATPAPLPSGVPSGTSGPRLTALAATCTGQYHLSKRATAQLLGDVAGVAISSASIGALEQTVSAGLTAPVAAVATAVREAPVRWMDETGWPQQREPDPGSPAAPPAPDTPPPPRNKPRGWLWVVVALTCTLFRIRRSRGHPVVIELLGPSPPGITTTDRGTMYHHLSLEGRQLCWAHLDRDFTKLQERAGRAATLGTKLRAATTRLFHLWHAFQRKELTRKQLQRRMAPVQRAVHALLVRGARADPCTATFCQNLRAVEPALWTFLTVDGVEPTNNTAERTLRTGVLWRKNAFGTQSQAGSQFVEHILTAVATCRQQHRPVLEYLTAVAQAQYAGTPAPALLPTA